jgi:hypothetical protein
MDDTLLKKYYNFDEADLSANCNGDLTPKQKARLAKRSRPEKKGLFVFGSIFLFIAVLPTGIMWLVGDRSIFSIIWSLIWIPVWGIIGGGIISFAFIPTTLPQLQIAKGPVKIERKDVVSATHDHELHVAGQTFEAEAELTNIMLQGDIYAIYYLEGTNEIMSAERLSTGE